MQVTVNKDKTEVTIVLPYSAVGVPSKRRNAKKVHIPGDGKSFLHFSANTKIILEGRETKIGINGYSENPAYIETSAKEEALTVETAKAEFAAERELAIA